MRKLLSGALLLAVVVPSLAQAQRRGAAASGAKHEFGVDVGVAYSKPDGADGGIEIGTPLAIRLGLVTTKKVMWEPRFALQFSSVGGSSDYVLSPGVNVLYAMAPGTHRSGMFLTGGAGLDLLDVGGTSGTLLAINAALGWRKPWGSAAWRYELGFEYHFENQDLGVGSEIRIGGRWGVSLWH